ncbi:MULTISPECIES: NHLP-related RiPP peptide [unclassified Streptomyces]|uniref:NHLP-related RiPP peptide n=1 Tax=unclassified Streptomyces TaxID=2593676 RepID=UPI0016600C71|nr:MULTISPECIES: NHLP-related RiPP peptide [unclassified Streptomyces]MBD0707260.1 hypothetical protein [Streptomyces sp. CBMA291]MBD0713748.1 hypothetical protein [Streptomyces sp. CBMA370]
MRTQVPGTEKLHLPTDVIDRLLDLLSTDDHFRRLFTENRHAALTQAGCSLTEEQLRAASPLHCLTVERLADKETIAAAHAELRTHLMADAAYNNPHLLDVGTTHAALRSN